MSHFPPFIVPAIFLCALVGFASVLVIHFAREAEAIDLWPVLNGLISFTITVVAGFIAGFFFKRPSPK